MNPRLTNLLTYYISIFPLINELMWQIIIIFILLLIDIIKIERRRHGHLLSLNVVLSKLSKIFFFVTKAKLNFPLNLKVGVARNFEVGKSFFADYRLFWNIIFAIFHIDKFFIELFLLAPMLVRGALPLIMFDIFLLIVILNYKIIVWVDVVQGTSVGIAYLARRRIIYDWLLVRTLL